MSPRTSGLKFLLDVNSPETLAVLFVFDVFHLSLLDFICLQQNRNLGTRSARNLTLECGPQNIDSLTPAAGSASKGDPCWWDLNLLFFSSMRFFQVLGIFLSARICELYRQLIQPHSLF